MYVPAYALVTLGTLKTPRLVETGIPFGLRTWNVVMSGMFLVVQAICNNSPSLIVASGKIGSLKAIGVIIDQMKMSTLVGLIKKLIG